MNVCECVHTHAGPFMFTWTGGAPYPSTLPLNIHTGPNSGPVCRGEVKHLGKSLQLDFRGQWRVRAPLGSGGRE